MAPSLREFLSRWRSELSTFVYNPIAPLRSDAREPDQIDHSNHNQMAPNLREYLNHQMPESPTFDFCPIYKRCNDAREPDQTDPYNHTQKAPNPLESGFQPW